MYKVQIVKSAIKELAKLPKKEAIRITEKISELKENPRPKDASSYLEQRMNIELEWVITEYYTL